MKRPTIQDPKTQKDFDLLKKQGVVVALFYSPQLDELAEMMVSSDVEKHFDNGFTAHIEHRGIAYEVVGII